MECKQAQELFSEHVDKRLDAKTGALLNEHLAGCVECRGQAERLERMNNLFTSMPQVEPPLGFQTRVMAHVQEQAARPKLWGWFSLPFQMGVPIQATAVVLIAVLAVFLYQQERPLEQRPTTPVPMPDSLASKSESASAPPPVEPVRKAESDGAPKLALRAPQQEPALSLERQSEQPLADAQRRGPAPSSARAFGAPGAPILENPEKAGSSGEVAPDYRLTVRLHVQLSTRKGEASADRAESAKVLFSSLSENQAERLAQARQRAIETGQAQSATLSLPRDKYEHLKQELRTIGALDPEPPREPRAAPSLAKDSGSVSIQLTLLPPGAR